MTRRLSPRRWLRHALALSLAAAGAFAPAFATAQVDRAAILMAHPAFPAGSVDTGEIPDSQAVTGIVLSLKRSAAQQSQLDAFLTAVQDSSSTSFHQWLTPSQFAAQFAPSADTVAPLLAWVGAQGMQVTAVSAGGMRVQVSGPASAVESAFGIRLHHLVSASGDSLQVTGSLTLPSSLEATVAGVDGVESAPGGRSAIDALETETDANTAAVLLADLKSAMPLRGELEAVLEQASAQGQTVLLISAPVSLSPSRALVLSASGSGAQVNTTPRPDWQAAPGLPSDGLRAMPDARATDSQALVNALNSIVLRAAIRQGEAAPVFYRLAPLPGIFQHSDASLAAGTWSAADGLGTLNVDALAQAWPTGSSNTASTLLQMSLHQLTHGATVTATAAVTGAYGTPTGTVTFTAGERLLGASALNASGIATWTTNALPGGQYPVTARYSGDGTYAASVSNAETVSVQPEPVRIAAVATGDADSAVPLQVTVESSSGIGIPSGTVEFRQNGVAVASAALDGTGDAHYTAHRLRALSASGAQAVPETVTAVYGGDASFQAAASAAVKLNPKDTVVAPISTTTSMTSYSGYTGPYGATFNMNVVVTPASYTTGGASPSGSVTIKDSNGSVVGTGTLSSGSATVAVTGLSVGTHSLTATYGGDGSYTGSSSTVATTITISTLATTVTGVLAPSGSVPYGYNASINISATPTYGTVAPTGQVTIIVAGIPYNGQLMSNGASASTASISFPVPPPGTQTISIACNTNLVCNKASVSLTTVKGFTTTTITNITPTNPTAGTAVSISASVANSGTGTGTYTYSGTMNFYGNGKLLGSTPVSNGNASGTITFPSALPFSVNAVYSGDTSWNGSTSPPLSVTPNPLAAGISLTANTTGGIAGQNMTLMAALTSGTGDSSLIPSGTITFYDTFNGAVVNLGTVTLVSNTLNASTAQISTTGLRAGSHSIQAVYSGDDAFLKTTSPALVITMGDFAISSSPSSLSIASGATATSTLTVSGTNFNGSVALSCAAPADTQATCTIKPSTVLAGSTATLTITTTKYSAQLRSGRTVVLASGVGFIALLLAGAGRRRVPALLALLLAVMAAGGGCADQGSTTVSSTASTSSGSTSTASGTPPGTLSFTITGAATDAPATARHTYTLPVTVQ